jgi:hypothetical protein
VPDLDKKKLDLVLDVLRRTSWISRMSRNDNGKPPRNR